MMGKWLAAVILAGGASLATIAARAAPPAPELPAGEFDAIHVHRLVLPATTIISVARNISPGTTGTCRPLTA